MQRIIAIAANCSKDTLRYKTECKKIKGNNMHIKYKIKLSSILFLNFINVSNYEDHPTPPEQLYPMQIVLVSIAVSCEMFAAAVGVYCVIMMVAVIIYAMYDVVELKNLMLMMVLMLLLLLLLFVRSMIVVGVDEHFLIYRKGLVETFLETGVK